MTQKAIIHTVTRVIRRLTVDEVPPIAPDESVVELSSPIDLADGFWKLDNQNNKVLATEKEIDDADVDEAKVALKMKAKRETVKAIIDDIANNGATLDKIQNYFKQLSKS